MKKDFKLVRRNVENSSDALQFETLLGAFSGMGYTLESCGMDAQDCRQAWAIMSKPEEVPPEPFDMLKAARLIAEGCKKYTDGCIGCPLDKHNQCLASGGLLPAYWTVTKEG